MYLYFRNVKGQILERAKERALRGKRRAKVLKFASLQRRRESESESGESVCEREREQLSRRGTFELWRARQCETEKQAKKEEGHSSGKKAFPSCSLSLSS